MSTSLGLSERAPVEQVEWRFEIEADSAQETIGELKKRTDARCLGDYCLHNPIDLTTTVSHQTAG